MKLEDYFLNENLMKTIAWLSVLCGMGSLIVVFTLGNVELLYIFGTAVKIIITCFTLWSFSKFHWDVMQGMIGALLLALLYQESFLVLGKLWGETADFDAFLIMGVQGSLYLAGQSMSFLMTIIIIVNHFIIDYSRVGNFGNVVFNQISIVFKILLYIFLMIINVFLEQPSNVLINSGLGFLQDLSIVILVVLIETQLDNFKAIRQDLLKDKAKKAKQNG